MKITISVAILFVAFLFPFSLPAYDSGVVILQENIVTTEHCNGNTYDPRDPGCVDPECRVAWTNDHWKLHLEFISGADAPGVHAVFCGEFDDRGPNNQTNEDLTVSLNGTTNTFHENDQYADGRARKSPPVTEQILSRTNRHL